MVLLNIFSTEQLILLVKNLARERLTMKQKKILRYMANSSKRISITQMVLQLSTHFLCSQAAIWVNIRQLKKIGLIQCGDPKNRGLPVLLSKTGRMISEGLSD